MVTIRRFAIITIAILLISWLAPALADGQIKSHIQKTKPVKSKTAWRYTNKKDEMTGEIISGASTMSTNMIHLNFPYEGGTIGFFSLRKHPRDGEDVFFGIAKGQLICSGNEGCTVILRFDDNPPVEYHAQPPSDYSNTVLIISEYQEILERLRTSKHLIIEAEFYQAGRQHFKFNTNGLQWQTSAEATPNGKSE